MSEDKNGAVRSFSYDGVGNLRSRVDRNDRLTQWDYDKLYRVDTETWRQSSSPSSAIARTLGYDYDLANRLIGVTDSDPSAVDFDFVIDARGQLQSELQNHKLMGGQNILFDRDFDAVGNRTKLEANIGGALSSGVISGGIYDLRNNYSFDRMDRMTSLSQGSRSGANTVASKSAHFVYDAASQVTDLRRYSSLFAGSANLQVHSRFSRDDAGRITGITHGGTEIGSGESWDGSSTPPSSLGTAGMLAGYSFVYDQANRLSDFASWADGTQSGYGYDDRGQLISAATTAIPGMTPPFGLAASEAYDFDAGGNRKSSGGGSQSASGTHNQLQTDGTYNYTYDGEGNTLTRTSIASGEVTEYSWDHRNRLVSVTDRVSATGTVTQRVEYIYDAFDQRVGKRLDADGNSTIDRSEAFVWADGQEVLRFVDSDGQSFTEPFRLASRYLWSDRVDQLLAEEQYADGSGPQIDASTASTTAGETLWPLSDHLGSVRGLVDNNGVIRKHIAYDSFGNRIVDQHYDTTGIPVSASHAEAVDTLFGFTGRDWDSDTGLQYNRARWYDPATGRWMNQDPIGFAAGDANLYRYVGNEPTTMTDPSGLVPPEDLEERLEAMVEDPKAKEEARRIARAIANTFANNSGWWRFPKIPIFGPDERSKRIFCYEWAWAFYDAFEYESSGKYFEGKVESSITDDLRVHYWLRIKTKDTGQAVYVDDGFWDVDETGARRYSYDARPLGGAYKYDSGGPISDKPRNKIWAPPFFDADGNCRGVKPQPKSRYEIFDNSGWGQPAIIDTWDRPGDNSGWGYGGF